MFSLKNSKTPSRLIAFLFPVIKLGNSCNCSENIISDLSFKASLIRLTEDLEFSNLLFLFLFKAFKNNNVERLL